MIERRRGLIRLLAIAAACLVLTGLPALARPPHRKALADYLGPGLARKLNDCRTCHLAPEPGADDSEDRPHNPFGKRLKAVRTQLRKSGKPSGIPARIRAVAGEDSDGDGVPNLLELVTGHFPGEAQDRPAASEFARGRATIAALERSQSGYPWNPFERVDRPPVPVVRAPGALAIRNPIDAFIAAEQTARGLTPRPEASRPVLLRRVTLDLTGLPPTPEELHDFLDDASPDAYEKVVDRLLASPRYGERWGRHWMDVWRYSDWAGWGQQVRDSQPHIWHWRDWIVESLNRDTPYDRMVVAMLAADEESPEDLDALRATGYLARNFKLLSREKWMQDVVDHTGQAFLGVTIGCARCHDHMYDPIFQKEYYQLRAIFEPHQVRIDPVPGAIDTKTDGIPRAFDAQPGAKTLLFIRGDDRYPTGNPLAPGVPESLGGSLDVKPVALPPAADRACPAQGRHPRGDRRGPRCPRPGRRRVRRRGRAAIAGPRSARATARGLRRRPGPTDRPVCGRPGRGAGRSRQERVEGVDDGGRVGHGGPAGAGGRAGEPGRVRGAPGTAACRSGEASPGRQGVCRCPQGPGPREGRGSTAAEHDLYGPAAAELSGRQHGAPAGLRPMDRR